MLWSETQLRGDVLYHEDITAMIHTQFHSPCVCVCVCVCVCARACVCVWEEGRRAPDRQRGCSAAARQLVQSTSRSAATTTSPAGALLTGHFGHISSYCAHHSSQREKMR